MNPNLKNLIQQLGEAIHESVSESEHIAGVVQDIRKQGFDVLLMLEATIGLNEVEKQPGVTLDGQSEPLDESGAPFSPQDVNFLQSLRISVNDGSEDSEAGSG